MPSSARATHNLRQLHTLLELTKETVDKAAVTADAVYRAREKRLFASEGADSDQTPWPELSEAYKKRKTRERPGKKILVWDGNMREAFTTKSPNHIAYAYNLGKGWIISLGAHGPSWWEAHQKGLPPMPKRDPQQSGLQLNTTIQRAIQRAILPAIQRAGRAFVQAMRVSRNG